MDALHESIATVTACPEYARELAVVERVVPSGSESAYAMQAMMNYVGMRDSRIPASSPNK